MPNEVANCSQRLW